MLKITFRGDYILRETDDQLKVLNLDNRLFGWTNANGKGDLFLYPHKEVHGSILSMGKFRLYEISKDNKYTNEPHLELSVGSGNWQTYLIPNGLPKRDEMSEIIATDEQITKTNSCSECKCGC